MRKRSVSTLALPLAALCMLACSPKASLAETSPLPAAGAAPSATKADFEWTGDAASVEVSTVNGDVRVVKSAGKTVRIRGTKSGKDAAAITIEAKVKGDRVVVAPKYPERGDTDARVDFVVEVPSDTAVEAQAVNGEISAKGIAAALALSTVNGGIEASECSDVRGNTVNGRVKVDLPAKGGKRIALEAVNGELELRMAASAGARVEANTLSGEIDSDFALSHRKEVVGSHASGTFGDGSTKVDLSTVNGGIKIKKA
jgi:DUF4097 and DUF4098 domain-containing protein YvlB